ncbi:MAG: hypothetical protein M3041_04455 [Acidobacteriota bacterium]|nr:hypothetical protein [Acidobacteriota bacterium]
MPLHLPGDEQAIGRAVDISVLDVHPCAIDEPMEILDRGVFFRGRDHHSAERNRYAPAIQFNADGVAVDHVDDSRHRYGCHESGRDKKAHDIYESSHLHFVVRGEFGSGRAEDRGLVWAAKSTTTGRLCEN